MELPHQQHPHLCTFRGLYLGERNARFLLEPRAAMLAEASVRPPRHIEEHSLHLEISKHLIDLLIDKCAVFGIVWATQAIPRRLSRLIFPLRFSVSLDHAPRGMAVMLERIENETVIARDGNAVFVAEIANAPYKILAPKKGPMHHAAFGRIIAKPYVRLEVDHGILHLGKLQVFYIAFGRELAKKGIVPIGQVHVTQMASVRILIPHFYFSLIVCGVGFYKARELGIFRKMLEHDQRLGF